MSTIEAEGLAASKPDGSDGLSFQQVIASARRLDELSCARVVGQIADAVHAAQRAGQPLGTVTPAAIVVAADGSVKLAPAAAATGYTAPEKLRGGSGDRRSDVFSLGVVLWEALAHERLFDGAGDDAVRRAVLAGAVRPPSEYNANVPAELDAICQRAVAAEPANRYQSAKVMAAEIDAVLGDAGYPDSNEAIAAFVTRALTKPPPGSKTSPLPAVVVAPAPPASRSSMEPRAPGALPAGDMPRSSNATLPPPAVGAPASAIAPLASRAAPSSMASATLRPKSGTQPPPSVTAPPSAALATPRPKSGTQPPPSVITPPSASAARSSNGTLPPVVTMLPGVSSARPSTGTQSPVMTTLPGVSAARSSNGTQPPATTAPATAAATTERAKSGTLPPPAAWSSQTGTSPSPFVLTRPPAPAAELSSATEPDLLAFAEAQALPTVIDAQPIWSEVKTQLRGSRSRWDSAPQAKSPVAVTAMLGSNALAEPEPALSKAPLAATAFLGSNAIDADPTAFASPQPTRLGVAPASLATLVSAGASPVMPGPDGALPSFDPPAMPPPISDSAAQPAQVAPIAPSEHASKHDLPAPFRASPTQPPGKESVATAATAATPHLGAPPRAVMSTQIGTPPGVTSARAAVRVPTPDTEFEDERHGDPSEVIALQHPEKGRDVLAGWGWSTGTTEALTDDEDVHDTARAGRKRLVLAVGGALAIAAAVAIVAFAFAGSPKPRTDGAVAQRPPATSPTATPIVAAAVPAPTVAQPAAPTGSATDSKPSADAVASAEAAKPITEAAKPIAEAAKPIAEAAKPVAEPPKTVAEAPKPVAEPPKAAIVASRSAAPEPKPAKPPETATAKKPPPKKPTDPKKLDAKHTAAPERVARASPRAQPIDPYAAPTERPKSDPAAAYKTGLQQYARGDTSGALATFRGSLSSNPGFAPTWRGIGLVYEKMGNKDQARSAFKRYLKLAPTASDADQVRERLERLGS